jgi:hypothetical protein
MSWDLQSFSPDEQEFRKIYKAREAFADQFGDFGPDPDDPAAQKKYQAGRDALNEELKADLGNDRYKTYTRGQDWNYQQLDRLAGRAGLPEDSAKKVFDIKDVAEEQAQKIRQDSSLSQDDRRAALQTVRDESQKAVSTLLGDKTFKSYQSQGGWWLQNIGGGGVVFSTRTTSQVIKVAPLN